MDFRFLCNCFYDNYSCSSDWFIDFLLWLISWLSWDFSISCSDNVSFWESCISKSDIQFNKILGKKIYVFEGSEFQESAAQKIIIGSSILIRRFSTEFYMSLNFFSSSWNSSICVSIKAFIRVSLTMGYKYKVYDFRNILSVNYSFPSFS